MSRASTVVYVATSLDGFIARADGALDWLGQPDPGEDYGWAVFLATVNRIVMGRITFEQVLAFPSWPYEGTPLTVLSRSTVPVPPHLHGKVDASSATPAALLADLGRAGCKRVYVDGGKTIQGFLAEDLVDELVVTKIPVLIGRGIPLFGPLDADLTWTHDLTTTYANGLVKSRYLRRR